MTVTEAKYVGELRLWLSFSDGTIQTVDFGPFLNHPHPQHDKYRRIANFKRFYLERGNIVWGKDWDLISHRATPSGVCGTGGLLKLSISTQSRIPIYTGIVS